MKISEPNLRCSCGGCQPVRPPDHPKNKKIALAWRDPGIGFNPGPADWMSDEELEQIAARVKLETRDIAHGVRLAQAAQDLRDACALAFIDLAAMGCEHETPQPRTCALCAVRRALLRAGFPISAGQPQNRVK